MYFLGWLKLCLQKEKGSEEEKRNYLLSVLCVVRTCFDKYLTADHYFHNIFNQEYSYIMLRKNSGMKG